MQQLYYIIPFFISTVLFVESNGQTSAVDGLKKRILRAATPREKISLIKDLTEQSVNADTLLQYVLMAESIAAATKDKTNADHAAYCRAGYYIRKNVTDSALIITESLIEDYKTRKDQQSFYLQLLFFKAKIFDRTNEYTKALAQLIEVIEKAEVLNDTLVQIQAKTGIGWVQMEMAQYNEALQWLYKAMHTSADKKFYKNYGALYSNMANAYNALGNEDSAHQYINIAIKDARENDNLTFLATALSMQARIFIDNNQSYLAEKPLNEALEIRKKLNDPFYTVFDMSSLASYYAGSNQAQKGITLCKEGIALAKQSGLTSQLLMIYNSLAENYKAAGNSNEYAKTLEDIIALKDSFNNINSAKLLADMQANIGAQKQEKEIVQQKLRLTKKNYWLYGSILFAVMGAVIAWMGFRNYRRRQKIKMQKALEEEKKLAAQAVFDAEEHERKRIAADLHDNLGAQANALLYGTEQLRQSEPGESLLLDNLSYTAKDMLQSLRETVWAMKHTDVKCSDIWIRIINFDNHLGFIFKKVKIITEGEVPADFIFHSTKALHIILIVQEAVNNAVRHAEASIIRVQSSKYPGGWLLQVNDDGKGFDHSRHQSEGTGLINMIERATMAGIRLEIESDPNAGTTIKLDIPCQKNDNPKGVLPQENKV